MNSVTTGINHVVSWSIASLSIDVVVLIVIFAILAIYGLYFGKSKLISFILAFYPAAFVYRSFPYLSSISFGKGSPSSIAVTQSLIFAFFFIICNLVVNGVLRDDFSFSKSGKVIEVALLSLSATILVVFAVTSIIASFHSMYAFSEPISGLFNGTASSFWWLAAPIAGIYLGNRFG